MRLATGGHASDRFGVVAARGPERKDHGEACQLAPCPTQVKHGEAEALSVEEGGTQGDITNDDGSIGLAKHRPEVRRHHRISGR